MRVHAKSNSAAVLRTLEEVITASGHEISPLERAELLVSDQLHPVSGEEASACVTVSVPGQGAVQALSLPVKLAQLFRVLDSASVAQALPMGAGWRLDLTERRAVHGETSQAIGFTEKECDLLVALLQTQTDGGLAREALLSRVWGMRHDVDTHTLETHIYRLRQKLEGASPVPGDIVTEQGTYRIVLDGAGRAR